MRLLLLVSIVFAGIFADAQDGVSSEGAITTPSSAVGGSEQNRVGKKFGFAGIVAGIGPSYTSTAGLVGVYHLDTNKLLLLEVTGGTLQAVTNDDFDPDDDPNTDSEIDIKSGSVGVHYKQFVTNSFYFRGGVDFRKMDYKFKHTDTVTPTNDSVIEFKGTSTALNFQVGNQWHWETFTLGCDWAGLSIPIASKVDEGTQFYGATTEYDRDRFKDHSDVLIKKVNLNIARFYIGATF